jgi:transposase
MAIKKIKLMNDLSNEEYKKYILNTVNELCPPKKKIKFTNEYYLTNFIYLLNDICKWKSLSLINKNEHQYHWKTIENKFRIWSKINVFEIAYNKMINDHIFSKNKSSTTLNLYMDATDISNVNGSEKIAYGCNKKKKQTKTSIICDRNKNIYGITFYPANIPDVKTIMTSINQIKDKFKFRKINMVTDKGYISEATKNELKKMNINLIYPHKKSMKKRTPKRSKNHLKFRYVVEHAIKNNKKNNRISLRKDRLISTFKSFFYLSTIINLQTFINKNQNKQQIKNSIQ